MRCARGTSRSSTRRCNSRVQDRLPHERASRAPICSWISGDIGVDAVDPAKHMRGQELVMVGGEMPVEPSAQLISQLLYLRRRRLKERIHGRPRSDRKRRFLLSAVAPSTSTRHPREAKPINWAQRGGLASRPGNCVLTPRPHFTAPSCTLGNRVVGASDGAPFRQERRPTRICRIPGAGSRAALPSKHSASVQMSRKETKYESLESQSQLSRFRDWKALNPAHRVEEPVPPCQQTSVLRARDQDAQ